MNIKTDLLYNAWAIAAFGKFFLPQTQVFSKLKIFGTLAEHSWCLVCGTKPLLSLQPMSSWLQISDTKRRVTTSYEDIFWRRQCDSHAQLLSKHQGWDIKENTDAMGYLASEGTAVTLVR